MVKITQRQNDCIGCGACAAIDPTNWKLDGDKAVLIDGTCDANKVCTKTVASVGAAKDAANSCPVKCIDVEE